MSMQEKFGLSADWPNGQLLRLGEPKSVHNDATGMWETTYQFMHVPAEPEESWSFGDEPEWEYKPFVQASTVDV